MNTGVMLRKTGEVRAVRSGLLTVEVARFLRRRVGAVVRKGARRALKIMMLQDVMDTTKLADVVVRVVAVL